ncbi:MAG TPA: glycosyltransferase family 39 protein [Opitutaceae bacterium]|nr:glycosyltransferase family 39 protein [Opitutaceae bacterium]
MTIAAQSTSGPKPVARLTWIAVGTLLVFYFTMALSATRDKGPGFDEVAHMAAGYNMWLHQDFRFDPANGDFIKRWAAIPYWLTHPGYPGIDDPMWKQGEFYVIGFKFLFQSGNSPSTLLMEGRAMVALIGVAFGLLVFLSARELFGDGGGLLALGLFAFCPHMLAHGALISTDLTLAFTLFASVSCIWRLLHEVTWVRFGLSLVALSLLLLSKMTAALIVPITGVLLIVRFFRGTPLIWKLDRERVITRRGSQALFIAGLIAVHVILAWVAIWACYDFKYSARANPTDESLTFMRTPANATPITGTIAASLDFCRKWHLFPEGYLKGPEGLLGISDRRPSFMDRQWKLGGWRTFFPYAFWVKTPPAILLLLPLGLAGWWWAKRKKSGVDATSQTTGFPPASLYAATPYLAIAAVYVPAAIAQNINIGHRHILILYPIMYVLAGGAALWWPTRHLWMKIVAGFLLFWFVADSASVRPHYLAYFSPVAGGPSQGHKHLIDSSLDWGLDLPGLKHWLDQHNPNNREPVFFSYFGTGSPDFYGIKSSRLPGFFEWREKQMYPLTPGYYAISATLLESVYTQTFGPWNRVYEEAYQRAFKNLRALDETASKPSERAALFKRYPESFWQNEYAAFEALRFGRICTWLRNKREPDDNVGYSIFIWKLDTPALQDAIFGPPAEMVEVREK